MRVLKVSKRKFILQRENSSGGSFKTYGGTERTENNLYVIEDTAKIETYFRPDIKSDCRVMLAESGATYDIINEPEDVEQRHKYYVFKVRRIKGGA